jgi:hypothetical protein
VAYRLAQHLAAVRWEIVLLAMIFAAGFMYEASNEPPLAAPMCINGADASGHAWPDEFGRPDPCGLT